LNYSLPFLYLSKIKSIVGKTLSSIAEFDSKALGV